MTKPTSDQAFDFALIIQAGMPAADAIRYFTDSTDSRELAEMVHSWQTSQEVQRAQLKLMGKKWQDMSLEERIKTGLDQHYNSLAYLLFSHNYVEATVTDKAKLDSARTALEAKLAGTAGKTDALSRFLDDVSSGRVRMAGLPSRPS